MKYFMIVLVLVASGLVATSRSEEPCGGDVKAMMARVRSSNLRTWEAIHESFKEYGHCDDGYVAEGYSDLVVTMLAHHWRQLTKLAPLSASDPAFHTFVLRHVDATTDERDLHEVLANATERCPASMKALCVEIAKQAETGLHDMAGQ